MKFFDTIFALSPTHFRAVGFKLLFQHNEAILNLVTVRGDIQVILLDRSNRLASFSSGLIGSKTNVWWVKSDDKTAGPAADTPARVPFDAEEFERFRLRLDSFYANFSSRIADPERLFELDYEDLLKPERQTALVAFLEGRPTSGLSADIVKQNSALPLDRFENPDEVRAHLEKISRSHWVEEVRA